MSHLLAHVIDGDGASFLLEWISVCDAPGDARAWEPPAWTTDPRLARVLGNGSSAVGEPRSARSVVAFNRAGLDETTLTPDELVAVYCHGAPPVRGWAMYEHTDAENNAWYAMHWPAGPPGETFLAVSARRGAG